MSNNETGKVQNGLMSSPTSDLPEVLPMLPELTARKIQTRYMTAVEVQKPRQLPRIVDAVMREAEYAGESFFYAWGEGKDHIEGPSVGLTLCVAREWGNCAVETEMEERETAYVFTSYFVDLETGFTISRDWRQSKDSIVYGRMDDYRKDNNRFQRGQSKSIRNVVKAATPSWLIGQALEKAKDSVRKGITKEGIVISTQKAFKALGQHGITEDRILAKIGRANTHEITIEDIISLRTAYSAISKGEAYANEIFPPSKINHAEGAKKEAPIIPTGKEKKPAKAVKEEAPPEDGGPMVGEEYQEINEEPED